MTAIYAVEHADRTTHALSPIGHLICMVPEVLRHAFSRELLFVVGP